MDARTIKQLMGTRDELVLIDLGRDFLKLIRQPNGWVSLADLAGPAPDDWRQFIVEDLRSEAGHWLTCIAASPGETVLAIQQFEEAVE